MIGKRRDCPGASGGWLEKGKEGAWGIGDVDGCMDRQGVFTARYLKNSHNTILFLQ